MMQELQRADKNMTVSQSMQWYASNKPNDIRLAY